MDWGSLKILGIAFGTILGGMLLLASCGEVRKRVGNIFVRLAVLAFERLVIIGCLAVVVYCLATSCWEVCSHTYQAWIQATVAERQEFILEFGIVLLAIFLYSWWWRYGKGKLHSFLRKLA